MPRDEDLHVEVAAMQVRVLDAKGTPTSLEIGGNLLFREWARIGDQLELQANASLWWIADWAAYGDRYRREYSEALDRIYERKSLHNLAYVARAVPPERRRPNLSFTHHAEVASLDDRWQTVWLDDAETHSWSTRELRAKVSEWRGRDSNRQASFTIRAVDELHDLCVKAAERVGLDPGEWARQTLEHAARLALAQQASAAVTVR